MNKGKRVKVAFLVHGKWYHPWWHRINSKCCYTSSVMTFQEGKFVS